MAMQFKRQGGGTAAGGGGGDIGMHSMAVEEEQQDTGQQDGYNEEDEAGDDFEDEDEECTRRVRTGGRMTKTRRGQSSARVRVRKARTVERGRMTINMSRLLQTHPA